MRMRTRLFNLSKIEHYLLIFYFSRLFYLFSISMNLEKYFDAHFYEHLFRKYKLVFYQNYLEYILIYITFRGVVWIQDYNYIS